MTESRDLPRRLVLDFPGVTPKAAAQTAVSGGLVRTVRIAANSREPLVTRVVMEMASGVTYHVERAGEGGRDFAVLFEPPLVMVARLGGCTDCGRPKPEPPMTMEQALANAAVADAHGYAGRSDVGFAARFGQGCTDGISPFHPRPPVRLAVQRTRRFPQLLP